MLKPLGIHRPKQTTFSKPHTSSKTAKIVTTSTTRLLVLETSRKTQYTQALNGTIYIPREVKARPAPVVGISLSQQPQQRNWPTHTPHAPSVQFSSVQSLSRVQLFADPWTAASLSITNSQSLITPSQWCHPTISSSVIPFSRLQSSPASGSFPVSQFFVSGGQSIGASALASVLPMNIQGWFPLGWTGWISLQSKGL